MQLFREPKPEPPPGPDQPESMGERIARLSRQTPVATSSKKPLVMALIGLVAIGGVIVTLATGTHPATEAVRRQHEEGERRAAREAETQKPSITLPKPVAPPAGPEQPGTPIPPAPPAPAATPPETQEADPDLAGLAATAAMAKPELRAAARLSALQVYGALVDTPKKRRAILIDAARLAPEMAPEEAPYFAALTKSAVEKALRSNDAATAAVLYLGSLRDRGGREAAAALEALVLDESRALELRVAAAHVLPEENRLRAAKRLDTGRAGLSPEEQDAQRKAVHPALRAALR